MNSPTLRCLRLELSSPNKLVAQVREAERANPLFQIAKCTVRNGNLYRTSPETGKEEPIPLPDGEEVLEENFSYFWTNFKEDKDSLEDKETSQVVIGGHTLKYKQVFKMMRQS